MDAVLFVAMTGIPWRGLPERFGKWNSVWRRFDRCCTTGVWEMLAETLGQHDLAALQLELDHDLSGRSWWLASGRGNKTTPMQGAAWGDPGEV